MSSEAGNAAERQALLDMLLAEEGLAASASGGSGRVTRRSDSGASVPVSFAQRRLWFAQQMDLANPAYNMPGVVRIAGRLDEGALERALREVIRRHEVLRTTFRVEGAEPVQVAAAADVAVEGFALERSETREGGWEALADAEAVRVFDLAKGPLVRAKLVRTGRADRVRGERVGVGGEAGGEWYLLLTLHHIVFDGWSLGILVRELAAFYDAAVSGRAAALPELAVQYADFAAYQRGAAGEAAWAAGLAYWRKQLAGLPRLELPVDRARPSVPDWSGARVNFALSAELSAAVARLGKEEGATVFMTLLAAFDVLLMRWTRQEDVVVGTPVAGRGARELEPLIGFFINSLVLRTDLSGNPTFRELLGRVKERALGAFAHQEVPFEVLVSEFEAERDLTRHPLFQTVFVLQNTPTERVALTGAELTLVERPVRTAKFDLTWSMEETAEGLRGWVEYSTALFEEATIGRMVESFRVLLANVVARPEVRVREVGMLTEVERGRLVGLGRGKGSGRKAPPTVDGGRWGRAEAAPYLIHERFAGVARRKAGRVALTCEGKSLTYGELDAWAEGIAAKLRACGVGPEAIVGLAAERSFGMVAGILGILKAGGAYLPLDPAYPSERLAYMLEDSGARVVLVQRSVEEKLAGAGAGVVRVELEREAEAPSAKLQAPREQQCSGGGVAGDAFSAERAAYVIYTSGSTGRPKGVVVTHANVARLMTSTEHWFGFGAEDVWTLYHSFAFDFSVWEIWGALLYGGRLVVVPYVTTRDYAAFYRLLGDEGVTVLNQTPSAFRQVMAVDEAAQRDGAGSALALRYVIFGGEALELQSLRGWIERHGDERPRLINMYGITETTVHVTYRRIRAEDVARGAGSVIGEPIPDLSLHVLEEGSLEPAPMGVAGELHVGGAGLARGYLGRPELTATRFVSDPFSAEPGARLYRSGDLARRLSDGDIEYLGRIDDQVKIRGFRIELGEIESVLAGHAAVREGVVVVSGKEKGEPRLVAYVVFRAGAAATVGELREHARRALPDYMVPAAFVVLEALPLTGNGKVDRRALPEPEAGRPELGTQFVAPASAAEIALARIWAEVLEVERVGVHDNFFALGGDSILSIRILTEAQKAGLGLTVQQLFQHQTIMELARVAGPVAAVGARAGEVEAGERNEGAKAEAFGLVSEAVRAGMPVGVVDAYPLTALQAGMLFHGDYDRGSAVFHDVFTQRLRMPWDEEKFAACWAAAVARHAVLRTSFALEAEGGPLQRVWAKVAAPVVFGDWRGVTGAEQAARVRALVEERKHAAFEWGRPPFFCVHLHRLSEDVAQFTIDFHHAILDGWSLATLVAEVFAEYLDERRGGGAAAPAENAFRQFVELEAAARGSEESRRFWGAQIEDGVFLRLPREAGLKVERTVHTESVPIAAEVSEGLKRLAAEAGVPVKTVLLAAHLRVLSVLGGQRDVMTGVTLNGRPEEAGAERALGLFLNTLPVRVRLAEQSFVELVRAVFAAEQAVLPHRRFPLAEIQKLRGREPLFEAAFNFVHFHVYQDVLGREDFAPLGGEFYEETNFALIAHFSLDVFSGNVALELKTDRRELSVAQSRVFAGFYQRCLEIMARAPEAPVLTTSLLTADERRKLLVEFNDTAADVPRVCVHERFERQAAATPKATAVVCDGARLTYQELNDSANRVAWALRARGLGRGAMVAICMERSLEMIVALFGVLKSGAAYVPLDPKYPAERLRLMVRDAGARLVLTNSAAGRQGITAAGVPYLDLCDEATALAEFSCENPASVAGWDDLIYVIFTSGSTGRPKGAGVWHRGFANLVDWYVKELELSATDSVLVIGSFTFDATHKNFYAPLVVGGTLNLLPPGPYDPEIIADLLEARKVTWLNCTPSAFFPLIEGDGAEARWEKLRTLRWLVLGGEPIPAARLERWLKESGGRTEVVNTYGPTEATDTTLYHWVTAEDLAAGGMIPTGRAPTNVALLIADDVLQPCPLGVAGELVLAGDYVGAGYVGDPERTAAKFVANPHPELPGRVIYRTGDLVRYRADGVVEFLGRVDHQVKVRGFRVEPGEIDAVLSALPAVRQAITVTRKDPRGDNRLVAYVEFHAGRSATVTELREEIGAQLPDYMVPSQFVIMTAWPLSPNNKVDRHALPAPDDVAAAEDNYVEPRTENERVLARIWGEVLRRERVGATDGFFTLGGDSILSIQVVSKARAAGLEISARDVFEHPTLEELAAVAVAAVSAKGKGGIGGRAEVSPVGGYSLSPVQQWFFEQKLAEPDHWNQAVLLEAKEPIDVRALEVAVNALVGHHDALRTRFVRRGEGWAGEVMPVREGAASVMRVEDFSAKSGGEVASAIEALANELQASLKIEAGELVRAAWIDLGGGCGGRLLMVIHHLVVDGVSWRVLAADLLAAYAQARAGAGIALPEKTAGYRAWAEGLKGVATLAKAEEAYWARVASDAAVTALPLDFAVSEEAEREAHEAVVEHVLEPAETQVLVRDFAARQRTNVEEVLLAAVARVLTAWSGRTAVWVDLESHGRDEIVPGMDVGNTVGWFTAMAPLRLELAGARDAGEALKAVKEQVRALPRNGIGFGLACRHGEGRLAEALRALPARDVVFNYLGQFDQALPEGTAFAVAKESAGRMRGARNRRTHRLQIVARVEGGRLQVEWNYSAKLHARETIAGLAEAFVAEVRGLIAAESGAALAPSDFALMDLRPDELDDLVSDLEDAKG